MAEQIVNAPFKARVIRFHAQKGNTVKEKDRVCDIEALKMELVVTTPVNGIIKEIYVSPGQMVEAGDQLFSVES